MKIMIQCVNFTTKTDLNKLAELVLFYWEHRHENKHIEMAIA